jgi:hypothetical protein
MESFLIIVGSDIKALATFYEVILLYFVTLWQLSVMVIVKCRLVHSAEGSDFLYKI